MNVGSFGRGLVFAELGGFFADPIQQRLHPTSQRRASDGKVRRMVSLFRRRMIVF